MIRTPRDYSEANGYRLLMDAHLHVFTAVEANELRDSSRLDFAF